MTILLMLLLLGAAIVPALLVVRTDRPRHVPASHDRPAVTAHERWERLSG